LGSNALSAVSFGAFASLGLAPTEFPPLFLAYPVAIIVPPGPILEFGLPDRDRAGEAHERPILELEQHRVVIAVGGEAYAGSVSTYRAAIDALPDPPPSP
jgi:hypothetical protein